WGTTCVEHLDGMFAFALWDADRGELFLARDRLGIKPLYYCLHAAQQCFLFASEVRALLSTGLVPRRLDPAALAEYLTYQCVPSPRSLIEDVRSLPPCTWMTVTVTGHIEHVR